MSHIDKSNVRSSLRQWRRELPVSVQQDHALRAAQALAASLFFRKAKRIACYLSVAGELDCLPLIQLCQQLGKEIYLPALHLHSNRLSFRRYNLGDPLQRSRFGMLQPRLRLSCPPWALDLVLMPLVAFDGQMNRIGMGGGYYDRTFASKLASGFGPRLFGWAHSGQQLREDIQNQPWDVPMAGVITEKGVICRGRTIL